mgnify:CR=1 FL=1
MAIGFLVNGMPEFSIFCGFFVPLMLVYIAQKYGTGSQHRNIHNAKYLYTFHTGVHTGAKAITPFFWKYRSIGFGNTRTRAITLEVAQGEPPIFVYALFSVIVAVGPIANTFLWRHR